MKKILLFAALLSCLTTFAQDSEGYFDISRENMRYICSPGADIQNHFAGSLDKKAYVTYNNSLYSETKGKYKQVKYRLGFTIFDKFDFSIPEGARVLLKFKNGQTVTLTTKDGGNSEYRIINGIECYWVTASYVVPAQTLNKIINVGISKIRIETQVRNFDVIPEQDIAALTKEYKAAIYKRYNGQKDSFNSDF